jgi:hypothetical protein
MSGNWAVGTGNRERTFADEPGAHPRGPLEHVCAEPSPTSRPASTGGPAALRRLVVGAGEAAAALCAAVVAVQLSRSIVVDPLDRVGQVSGVAGLDLRFVVLGLLVLAACAAAGRRPAAWAIVSPIACATVAGLATGLVAGGILLALRGTQWPLFANWGDSGQLIRWADDLLAGRPVPADYPPVVIHTIAALSGYTGDSTASALRTLQVAGTAVFGPIAYLSWRLLLTPAWALAVTLVAAMPLLEPYKPYTTVVLVALIPAFIAFLGVLGRTETMAWRRVVVVGIGTGAALGVLFSVYSGWFLWSAPGVLVAALAVFPWRSAVRRAAVLLGLTSTGFAVVAAPHLIGLLRAAGTVEDRYFYFDTMVDPAYIAMWRNDLPGAVDTWPPVGELGGVGLFTVLLVVGMGVAVAIGGRQTAVLTLCTLMAGAWLLRFWLASQMYATQSVQLYPRTSAEILYCLLLLTVFAIHLVVERARQLTLGTGGNGWVSRLTPRSPAPAATIGLLCAALLLALSVGSSIADRYMPRNDDSVGLLAYVAQMVRQPDGRCPDFSAPNDCAPDPGQLLDRTGRQTPASSGNEHLTPGRSR